MTSLECYEVEYNSKNSDIIYQKPNKLVGRVNGAVTKIQYVLFTSLLTKDVILEEEWGSEVL